MAPRWTYSEANASRWRPLFDDLLGGVQYIEVPLQGNGKSLCSLRIRIGDALKWLADGFRKHHREDMKPYALLKRWLRFKAVGDTLVLSFRRPPIYREILDPDLRRKLERALERPDLTPEYRQKILRALGIPPKADGLKDPTSAPAN